MHSIARDFGALPGLAFLHFLPRRSKDPNVQAGMKDELALLCVDPCGECNGTQGSNCQPRSLAFP
eukprot:scaffold7099_cov281-Pinguiococcus_pyrenoidosus.AAC.17